MEVVPERKGNRGRSRKPYKVAPEDLIYATVHKRRKRGKAIEVSVKVVFGTLPKVQKALEGFGVCKQVNISFVERYHSTVRHRNSRKARKVYTFSKGLADAVVLRRPHEAMSYFALSFYNFCRPHYSLHKEIGHRQYQQRTPAMAAGITDQVWSLEEFMRYPTIRYVLFTGH